MRTKLGVLAMVFVMLSSLTFAAGGKEAGGKAAQPEGGKKYKFYFSLSVIGNEWMTSCQNMLVAMTKKPEYRDKIDLKIQVSGDNAQKQIQQIEAMVKAGANAIIIYPISPTALDQAIKAATDKGIVVYCLDGKVEEPSAHSMGTDAIKMGETRMEWLAKEIKYKGNIVRVTGIPGTLFNTEVEQGIDNVLKKYPNIKVIASVNGEWSQTAARARMTEVLATHSWDDIDGIITQYGGYTLALMQIEAGRSPEKLLPIAGEAENGQRIMMLPPGTVDGAYGMRSISIGTAPYQGALAVKLCMDILDGKTVPQHTIVQSETAVTGKVKMAKDGSFEELKNGANVFSPTLVSPTWNTDIYLDELGLGLNASLLGEPD
jgi:ribose transport system substrate-binding protein